MVWQDADIKKEKKKGSGQILKRKYKKKKESCKILKLKKKIKKKLPKFQNLVLSLTIYDALYNWCNKDFSNIKKCETILFKRIMQKKA